MNRIKKVSLYLSAGAIGALVNSLVVWLSGATKLTALLGASLAPDLTPPWLYQRITWGAIWGLLFFFPIGITGNPRRSLILRGLLVSLGPILAQLFLFFPASGKGLLGLQLGVTVPFLVICFNAVWGLVAATWIWAAQL
ncbi:hypothetical protein H6S82_11110 [Planktothrix sp. FACHB-1355]|uniref:Uncharacterized protein n=1 Tax=Aerosakkonema funiforme FACHB-1375 TaxID=2949571 RepID=A0A926V982_9CYAN|nr:MULTISPECIES: hypothetical protein [Oscillatoriales]MBD2179629.1 hypothetical protein [Aerosakkonema funiforme FACHB-1375]MBD3559409.1 hypothetical protein [Planktothrix sp. FACHB-1355]